MRKPTGVLGAIGKRCQQNATKTATKAVYQVLFNEKPRIGGKKKKS